MQKMRRNGQMLIKEFQEFRTWKRKRKEEANRNREYFINSFNDTEFWRDVVKQLDKDEDLVVEMKTIDGTKVTIYKGSSLQTSSKRVNWER